LQKSERRSYSPSALSRAYAAVKEKGVSVKRAAQDFCVPTQTLRDRVLEKVDVNTAEGPWVTQIGGLWYIDREVTGTQIGGDQTTDLWVGNPLSCVLVLQVV